MASVLALAKHVATPETTRNVETRSERPTESPCSGAATSRLMINVSAPNGARSDCGAKEKLAMSRRPHEAERMTPMRLRTEEPRRVAQRCRLRPPAFIEAARHARVMPMTVDEMNGEGAGTSTHERKSSSGLADHVQICSSAAPPRKEVRRRSGLAGMVRIAVEGSQ